jgi:hypothetical protein
MARLPQPGADEGLWGEILNDYLVVSHNSDGTVKNDAITSSAIQDASIAGTKLQDGAITIDKLADGTGINGQILTRDSLSSGGFKWDDVPSTALATASTPGTVQLAGDLGGTATVPTVPGLATKADLNGSGYIPLAQLGSGTPSADTFLSGDNSWTLSPVATVAVATGSEARPNAQMVFWIGGTIEPTNMDNGDVWMMEA